MFLKLISARGEIYFSYFLSMVQVFTEEENNMAIDKVDFENPEENCMNVEWNFKQVTK